jgi:hypothetical protein
MKRAIAAFAAIAFSALPTAAQTITVTGYGTQTCSKWLELHRTAATAEAPVADNWLLGYVSAAAKQVYNNRQLQGLPPHDILKGTSPQSIMALMNDSCGKDANRTIDAAAAMVAAQLIAQPDPVVMAAHREGASAFAAARPGDLRRLRPVRP